MLSEYISLKWFLISFAVGILILLLFVPAPTVVVKFPNPETAGKQVYQDTAGTCYKYRAEKVECTPQAKEQPISEEFTRYAPHALP